MLLPKCATWFLLMPDYQSKIAFWEINKTISKNYWFIIY